MEWLGAYRGVFEAASVILLLFYCIQIYRTWNDLSHRDGGIRRIRAYVIALGTAASVLQVLLHVDSFACFQIYPAVVVALLWSFLTVLLVITLHIMSYQLVSTTFELTMSNVPAKQRKFKIVIAALIVFHALFILGRSVPHGYEYEIVLWVSLLEGGVHLVIIAAVTYRSLKNTVVEFLSNQLAMTMNASKRRRNDEEKVAKAVRLWRAYLIYIIFVSIGSTAYFSFQIRSLLLAKQARLQNGEEIEPFFFAPGSICDSTQSPEDFRVSIPGNIFPFTEIMCHVMMFSVPAIMLFRYWKNTKKLANVEDEPKTSSTKLKSSSSS